MFNATRSPRPSRRYLPLVRPLVSILFLFPAIGQSQGVEHLPADSRVTVDSMLAAVRSGNGAEWAAALQAIGRAPDNFARALPDLDFAVRSVDPSRRLRALTAIGAIARPATLPWTVVAVTDSNENIRHAAVFALSRSYDGSDTALSALLNALADTTPFGNYAREAAVFALTRNLSPTFSARAAGQIRDALHAPSPATRLAGLYAARDAQQPWGFPETLALLRDSVAFIRQHAALAMLAWRPASTAARAELQRLAQGDPDADIRETASKVLNDLGNPVEHHDRLLCSHRPHSGLIAMEFEVGAGSRSLRDDGRGTYREGDGAVSSSQYTAYNLMLPFASDPNIATYPTDATLRVARKLSIDLSSPVPNGGGRALGMISDSAARFHTFFMIDHSGTIWNFREIPVLGRIESDRTQIGVTSAGRQYILVFGPWALGQCGEEYAKGSRLRGNGTTPVRTRRISETEYHVSAPPGAISRLWDVTDMTSPQDRGLYYFSFEVTLRKQ